MLSVHIIIAPVQCELSPQLMIMGRRSTGSGKHHRHRHRRRRRFRDDKGWTEGRKRRENRGEGWVVVVVREGVGGEEEGGRGAVLLVIMKDDSLCRIIHQRRRCLSPHFCALLCQ